MIVLWKATWGVTRQGFKRDFSRVTVKFYILMGFYVILVYEFFKTCMQQKYTYDLCFSVYVNVISQEKYVNKY